MSVSRRVATEKAGSRRLTPTVSYCIPASRDPKMLREAIASVLSQGFADLEVIVTDDSGGSLAPVVDSFGDERIRYIANPRRLGFAGNHVAALSRAEGAFIGILHDDDLLLPGFIDAVLEPLREDPSLGVSFSGYYVESRDHGQRRREQIPVRPGSHSNFLAPLVQDTFLVPSVAIMRRDVWDRGRHVWPDIIVADYMMYLDAALAGWGFHHVSEPLAVRRLHELQVGASEARHRGGLVTMWDSYRFEDPDVERLRRHQLAWALVGRAGTQLKAGRARSARADLARARRESPETSRKRRLVLAGLCLLPGAAPAAGRAWRRLNPN
jgi:glycosyltransferase involved in cell wall biosynthesis